MKEHIESLVLSMNVRCINCTYKITCDKANEETRECKDFKKISYDTKLVKLDGPNYKFERIDE